MNSFLMMLTLTMATLTFVVGMSLPTNATQAMAQKTGKGCSTCHTAPPKLNATGKNTKRPDIFNRKLACM